ncbi:hypothetical protein J6590_099984 [Homalodisca vitripennis]|nr:hypothetical protein J6590_099984 [Homalodisca vitripennis]
MPVSRNVCFDDSACARGDVCQSPTNRAGPAVSAAAHPTYRSHFDRLVGLLVTVHWTDHATIAMTVRVLGETCASHQQTEPVPLSLPQPILPTDPIDMIKSVIPYAVKAITHLVNVSLVIGGFPKSWKQVLFGQYRKGKLPIR